MIREMFCNLALKTSPKKQNLKMNKLCCNVLLFFQSVKLIKDISRKVLELINKSMCKEYLSNFRNLTLQGGFGYEHDHQ